ncbi:MAG TPA: SH3 domain-containing protein [Hyphomicrobiaceae bacterium]|nr:SH3 domain-containing protein [Hyphomicrobiaceae bacterium]
MDRDLKEIVPGSIIHLDTPLGTVVPISHGEDGSLNGRAGAVAFYLGSYRDRGHWWIANSRLCHRWGVWFKGKARCLEIRRKGSTITWRDEDGETGTATIKALKVRAPVTAEPPSPLQPPIALGGPDQPANPIRRSAPVTSAAVRRAPAPPPLPARVARSGPRPAVPAPSRAARQPTARTWRAGTQKQKRVPQKQMAEGRPAYRVIGVHDHDVLNIRAAPDPHAAIISTLAPSATGVRLSGACNGTWCPVFSPRGRGWVHASYLAPQRRENEQHNARLYGVVNVAGSDVLNIRKSGSDIAPIVGALPPNARNIRILGACRAEWCRVTHREQVGWVNRFYIAPQPQYGRLQR